MNTINLTFKSNYNSSLSDTQPIKANGLIIPLSEFDSFESTTNKEPEGHPVRNGALIGAASGLGVSLVRIFNKERLLQNFDKYKQMAIKKAMEKGEDVAQLTDDFLKKEITESKQARKYAIPLVMALWTTTGAFVGTIGAAIVDAFKSESDY